jgi:hypothetical protein
MVKAFETVTLIWTAMILVYGTIAVTLIVAQWAVRHIRTPANQNRGQGQMARMFDRVSMC